MSSPAPTKHQAYDVIVVGGGTAGCVLAARLTEIPDCSVLLLEAGGNHNADPRVTIPGLFSQAFGDPTLDWNFTSEPQEGLGGESLSYPRGKGLGGSSLINLLGLVYPSRADLDAWSELGNAGWDWKSMFPYLQKFQTFHPPNSKEVFNDLALDYIDQDAQGKSGPIQASYPQTVHPFGKAWIETFRALGHEITSDTMSGTNLGGYQIVSHIDPQKGERSHAGNAYLEGSFQRKNLDFVLDAEVEKVLFKKLPTLSATGVQYRRHGQTFIVEALKEVVICTGSFHSPCLLERSGIGDPKLLGSLGVDVIIPNPNVGENLQDHMLCGVAFEAKDEYETLDNFRDPEYAKAAMEEYQRSRAGPMTQTSSSFAYMSLTEDHISGETISMKDLLDQYPSHSKSPADTLIRQILSDPNEASVNFCMFQAQSHCDKSTLSEHFSITSPGKWASIFASLSHPLSRGSVHSQSINPSTPPVIDPRVYTHPLDVEIMSLHIRFFQKITSTAPFSSLLKPNGRRIPEFASFETLDDAKKVATKCTLSNMHPIGTCAMLPEEKGGVVDARLKVHGVKGLRICDASVMPILTRGNIISTVYAVAEKGADLIKEDLFGSY